MSEGKSISAIQRRASTQLAKRRLSNIQADETAFRERNEGSERWQDSSTAKECKLCQSKFTLTNRKHHCRLVLL